MIVPSGQNVTVVPVRSDSAVRASGASGRPPSTKVADAAITYSGRGTLQATNRPGWLTRFFLNVLPF